MANERYFVSGTNLHFSKILDDHHCLAVGKNDLEGMPNLMMDEGD